MSTVATNSKHEIKELLKNDVANDSQSSEDLNKIDTVPKDKPKKSIFSSLLKKRGPKMKITKKVETFSSIDFGTESLSSDHEIFNYEHSDILSNPVEINSTDPDNSLLQKIMKRPKNPAKVKHCYDPTNCNKSNIKVLAALIPTTYIPKQNIKIITGINELQDTLHNLHHSEHHMIYLLKKYVADKNVEKQLFDASFEYFALQYDSKTQVNVLANKMWFQQIQVAKMEDYNLQKRLNGLVKTNRVLEDQVETLNRQCEKLASKTNVYPKRFLHMRSFGKIYAKQLIDNNRKLHKKINTLTVVLSGFEEEIERLQHQKAALEDERRSSKSQIHSLEALLDKKVHDYEIERSSISVQLSNREEIMKEVATVTNAIFHDVQAFGFELEEFGIKIDWPMFEFSNVGLLELLYQLRGNIRDIFLTLIRSYKNLVTTVKDMPRLRTTNARLQANLQKSTSELDNLSKKLAKNPESDVKSLELKCRSLEKENVDLRMKLNSIIESDKTKQKTIDTDILDEYQSLNGQIDEVILTVLPAEAGDMAKAFSSSREKLNLLKVRNTQIMAEQKHLVERCNYLEDENQNITQTLQTFQHDMVALQDGITLMNAENETIKKNLATEHQTVLTLQSERLKYLEEKNILKTIFQHLKSEVTRIQQLEGAVADMSKETSRLTFIAEFNKQLGEQLKSEVETKESTIQQLRESLERLSHLQIDTDKEKVTLSAQLSEVVTVKEKLSSCLELELKKNMSLDESKKQLEHNTQSQLKVYEEMQKNERAALKELLKDFRNLIKQRDSLILIHDESKHKYKDLERSQNELRKQYNDVVAQGNEKEEEIKKLMEKLQIFEDQLHNQEEGHRSATMKYEKTIRKMEKLLAQFRCEKEEVEKSTEYLKNNIQKLQTELNATREKASNGDTNMAAKIAECATLASELSSYKNNLHTLQQEHGKLIIEMEYLKKLHEQQISDLKGSITNCSNKEATFLELQSIVLSRDQQINELDKVILEKEGEIKRLEQECKYLGKRNEDQTKILMGYEDHLVSLQDVESCKIKLEKELSNIVPEHKATLKELENSKREIETLRSELRALISRTEKEREFHKNQTKEMISEYNEQKSGIEEEIENISGQLRMVTENLHSEKRRFEELAKAHEQLRTKYGEVKNSFDSEMLAHKDSHRKIEGMDSFIQTISKERDYLQQQMQLLFMEINSEREVNRRLIAENNKLEMILEQGKEHYKSLERKSSTLEQELNQVKLELKAELNKKNSSQDEIDRIALKLSEKNSELKLAKETIEGLRKELNESQKALFGLKEEFFKLQQQVTGLEFKNCELTLQLHETQGKLETEKNLYKELQQKLPKSPRPSPVSPSSGRDQH